MRELSDHKTPIMTCGCFIWVSNGFTSSHANEKLSLTKTTQLIVILFLWVCVSRDMLLRSFVASERTVFFIGHRLSDFLPLLPF